jgi:hypothetical protein
VLSDKEYCSNCKAKNRPLYYKVIHQIVILSENPIIHRKAMILQGGYKEQYQRVLRYSEKIKNQDRSTLEYSDDIWAFFQSCWHLKDWIKNDLQIPSVIRNKIEEESQQYDSLMICADLSNRSKHLELKWNRRDAKITGIGVTIHMPTIYLNRGHDDSDLQEKGYVEHPFYIETSDGKKLDGLSVANQAIDDWRKILQKFSLPLT